MRKSLFLVLFGFALGTASAFSTSPAAAADAGKQEKGKAVEVRGQEPGKGTDVKGPSDRSVRVLLSLAWSRMPAKIVADDGTKIEIEKSDPNKFMLPVEDARRVIMVADRSATAKLCQLEEAHLANFVALMNSEQRRNKWSREQLHMIKWVYQSVLDVRTGDFVTKEGPQTEKTPVAKTSTTTQTGKPGAPTTGNDGMRDDFRCSETMRADIQAQIEEFVKSVSPR